MLKTWTAHAQAAQQAEEAGDWFGAWRAWDRAMGVAPDPALRQYAYERHIDAHYRRMGTPFHVRLANPRPYGIGSMN